MYSRCLFCTARLGRNDIIERFPVGRRIAFDGERGRLWVLCGMCRGWNLAPLDERWEAVEALERAFEGAAAGASTEHVALRRAVDGTLLVRIGRAAAALEVAGWRYGRALVKRWRNRQRTVWGLVGGGFAMGLVSGISMPVMPFIATVTGTMLLLEQRPFMRTGDGTRILRWDRRKARLLPGDGGGDDWILRIPRPGGRALDLTGYDGLRALRGFVRHRDTNRGSPAEVRNAIEEARRLGSPKSVIAGSAAELASTDAMDARYQWWARPYELATAHPVILLALEMAADEAAERIAMESEAALLQREWRDAAEIATIADSLALLAGLRARLQR